MLRCKHTVLEHAVSGMARLYFGGIKVSASISFNLKFEFDTKIADQNRLLNQTIFNIR